MHVVADANIPCLDNGLAPGFRCTQVDGRSLGRADLAGADALLVRSVTRVGPELLDGTSVRFVGTATIGTDHLDLPWLESRDITWCSAPGCNADAAAQYTLAMMWLSCERLERPFREQTIGVIGRGRVGSRLVALLQALDMDVVACDPPLSEQGVRSLVSQAEALDRSVVTFHVPLSETGPHATRNMVNAEMLAQIPPGGLLVNAARGGIIDHAGLSAWLARRQGHAALDTWPFEPGLSAADVQSTVVGSPHVAGYSLDGKHRGARMVLQRLHDWAGLVPPAVPELTPIDLAPVQRVRDAVIAATRVADDDRRLRDLARRQGGVSARAFDRLRRDYPVRRDFQGLRVRCTDPELDQQMARLGFRTERQSIETP